VATAFADYIRDIDRILIAKIELGVNDLQDYDFSGAYNDEVDPEEVADDMIAENNYPGG